MAKKSETKDILKKIQGIIAEGESHCISKHNRVLENLQYERGLQWSSGDLERQAQRERPAIPNNSIIKVINAVANREIVDRFEPRVYGRSDADGGVATVLDKGARWQRNQSETEHEESQAFRSCVASGYGVMHKYFDGGAWDGEGKICDEEIAPWDMLWPAKSRKMNLTDRRWHVYGKVMDISEAEYAYADINKGTKKTFAKINKELGIFSTTGQDSLVDARSSSKSLSGLSWGDVRRGSWYNIAEKEIFVVEAEWIDAIRFWRVAVPVKFWELWGMFSNQAESIPFTTQNEETGEDEEIQITRDQVFGDEAQEGLLQQLLQETEIQIIEDASEFNEFATSYESMVGEAFKDFYKPQKEIVKFAIVTDDTIIDSGERPYGFTFEFLTGWRIQTQRDTDFYGVIDVAKGPQDFKNGILSNMLSVYMSSPKNHLLIQEDAIQNSEEWLNQFARPIGVTFVPTGFIAGKGTTWDMLEPPRFPPMQDALLQLAYTGVEELFGLSSIDLGTQGDLRRVSGNVVQAAKTAGNTIVAVFFDALRRYRKRFGLLNLKFISEHYSPQQLIRIIGEENTEDVQLSDSWDSILRYDVNVEESPVTASEKMEILSRLQQVGSIDQWLQRGDLTFEDVITYFIPGLPEDFKRKVAARAQTNTDKDKEIQDLQSQLSQSQAYQTTLLEYMKQVGANQLVDQFNALMQMAIPMSQQIAAQQQETESAQEG